jgi:hypothetical protein
MGTEEIGSLARAHEVSCPFPMNARFPISVLGPMTFAAEAVALREVYEFSIIQSQFISIFSIMTIKAPPHCLSMMKLDLRVLLSQLPLFSIYLQGCMAVVTRKHSLRHGERSNRELFTRPACKGRKADSQQK